MQLLATVKTLQQPCGDVIPRDVTPNGDKLPPEATPGSNVVVSKASQLEAAEQCRLLGKATSNFMLSLTIS